MNNSMIKFLLICPTSALEKIFNPQTSFQNKIDFNARKIKLPGIVIFF